MRIVLGAWILFTVGLLAMLVSCPSHAQVYRASSYSFMMHRGNFIIAAYPGPNGFICTGTLVPRTASCHPAIEWHEWAIVKISRWI